MFQIAYTVHIGKCENLLVRGTEFDCAPLYLSLITNEVGALWSSFSVSGPQFPYSQCECRHFTSPLWFNNPSAAPGSLGLNPAIYFHWQLSGETHSLHSLSIPIFTHSLGLGSSVQTVDSLWGLRVRGQHTIPVWNEKIQLQPCKKNEHRIHIYLAICYIIH